MERMTKRTAAGVANIDYSGCYFKNGDRDKIAESARRQIAIERLAAVEDILGDDYDLDRLRELVEADRDGRCELLPLNGTKSGTTEEQHIFVVTYYDMGQDPVVTVFNNKPAAVRCYEYFFEKHDVVNIDEAPVYKMFFSEHIDEDQEKELAQP